MPTIDIGSHTCDIIDETTAGATGGYSFSTDEGTISGTIYKHIAQGLALVGATVLLLQSQSDATLYCVYAEDEPMWGSRAAPYPLQAAPFTQNIELGFYLNARFQIDGVYTDDVNLTLVFTAYDEASGNTCRFVWGGGEGARLDIAGRESAIVADTVGGLAGTVKHYYPAQGPLVFPCGEGASCQRYDESLSLADYRDDSAETAAAGLLWYITAATLYYSGDEETEPYSASWDIPLDGTATTCNYEHSTIHVTGQANADVTIYTRSVEAGGFDFGYQHSISLGAGGAVDIEDLAAGEYVLLGHATDEDGFTHLSAPVTVEVGWGETVNAAVTLVAFEPDGDDLYWGYWMECPGEPLASADIYCNVRTMDGEDEVGCRTVTLGTTDGDGYGPVGHDGKFVDLGEGLFDEYESVWVEGGTFGGLCAVVEETDFRPFRSVGARVVIKQPRLALLYAGQGEYEHLHGRAGGFRLEPGDDCPGGATSVPLHWDPLNGYLYSDPVPRMAGTWDPCVHDDPPTTQCKWELWVGGTLVSTTIIIEAVWIGGGPPGHPTAEYDAGNNADDYGGVAGRIRGSHVDWSGAELTTPERPVDDGLEFGAYSAPAFRVIAELHDPEDEDYGHSAGFVAHVCPYCGKRVRGDPGDGALRGFCVDPLCGRDARAYWDVFPCAEADHRLYVVTPNARELTETRLLREAWYRPEDYDTTVAYRHSPSWQYRYLAAHITLGDWDYSGGFSVGTGMAERGVVVDRTIGPAQAKIEVVTAPSEGVQIRVEGVRTDNTHLYYYGTVPASAEAGDVIKFEYVLPVITDPQTDRRALARIYEADEEGWPCASGDVVDSLVNAWAWDGDAWRTVASWLTTGEWRFVNDGPSYRHTAITVTRAEVSPYSAHIYALEFWRSDIAIDWAGGFVHRVAIDPNRNLVAQRLARPFEDNLWRSTDTMTEDEVTVLDSAVTCAEPKITCVGDGTFRVVYMRADTKVRAYSTDGLQTLTEQ